MTPPFEDQLECAAAAARAAGSVIRESFGQPIHTEFKSPTDPVTEVDRRCEVLIRESLHAAFPEIDFWGEEFGRGQLDGPACWIVDPLDGTKNFVHGYPFVAVSVALVDRQGTALGVVYDPLRDELFHATRGGGAFCNEQPLEVSRAARLEEALVVTGFTNDPPRQKELLWDAMSLCQGLRRGGASALDLCQVAAGRLDAMWEWQLAPWDMAAASLIISEAQGTVSRLDGSSFDLFGGQILATNTSLHRAFVDLIASR